jgi:hypothetical protein
MKEENKKNIGIKKVISGDILQTKAVIHHIPMIFIITLLLILYIASRYNIERTIRDINKLSKEVSELQKHSLKVKTTYQTTTKMLYLNNRLEGTGVTISKEPIKDIIIIDDKAKKE